MLVSNAEVSSPKLMIWSNGMSADLISGFSLPFRIAAAPVIIDSLKVFLGRERWGRNDVGGSDELHLANYFVDNSFFRSVQFTITPSLFVVILSLLKICVRVFVIYSRTMVAQTSLLQTSGGAGSPTVWKKRLTLLDKTCFDLSLAERSLKILKHVVQVCLSVAQNPEDWLRSKKGWETDCLKRSSSRSGEQCRRWIVARKKEKIWKS